MKMLYLTSSYPPPMEGGHNVYLYNIVSHLPPSIAVVYADIRPDCESFDAEQDYRVIRTGSPFTSRGKAAQARMVVEWTKALVPIIKQEEIDILHSGYVFPEGLIALLLSRFLDKPYVLYVYAEELNKQLHRSDLLWGRLKGAIYRQVIRHAHGVVTVSDYTSALLENFGRSASEALKVTPMVAEPPEVEQAKLNLLRAKYNLKPEQRMILSVGRLIERKGHDFLIRSMPKVLDRFPATSLVVVGRGPYKGCLVELCNHLGLCNNIIFTGFVSQEELAALYNLCDVFVLPHRETDNGDTEGCPTVFLEAGAYGKPVIGGLAGGVQDAILDGETGFIVDGRQPGEIASVLIRVLADPLLARCLGESGRRRVLTHLTPDRGSEMILSFSRTIVQEWESK